MSDPLADLRGLSLSGRKSGFGGKAVRWLLVISFVFLLAVLGYRFGPFLLKEMTSDDTVPVLVGKETALPSPTSTPTSQPFPPPVSTPTQPPSQPPSTPTPQVSACTPGWFCSDDGSWKFYMNPDCSTSGWEQCPSGGCVNGQCLSAPPPSTTIPHASTPTPSASRSPRPIIVVTPASTPTPTITPTPHGHYGPPQNPLPPRESSSNRACQYGWLDLTGFKGWEVGNGQEVTLSGCFREIELKENLGVWYLLVEAEDGTQYLIRAPKG